MSSNSHLLNIERLIDIVRKGGAVRTGVDIYNRDSVLLLEKNVMVSSVKPLLIIQNKGVGLLEINPENEGGLWDRNGRNILPPSPPKKKATTDIKIREKVEHIAAIKTEAAQKYRKAKENVRRVLEDIRKTGGEFDRSIVEETVSDLLKFITRNDSAFFYLTREIFSYDDYLYHHSINVCTIGTAIMKKAIEVFGDNLRAYSQQELQDISTGFFLHDVGKVLVPYRTLNKPAGLTPREFELVKEHSYKFGVEILKKNKIQNRTIREIVRNHHAPLFDGEDRCYPAVISAVHMPPHVRVAKLADIYDAMTSKRCYKEAYNPVSVVTGIVRNYAGKEDSLQFLLHSFVKSIGIYPPGSVVYLVNNRMAYILDSDGPIVIPFTNELGDTLRHQPDPIDLSDDETKTSGWQVDDERPLVSPIDAYRLFPEYLRQGAVAA
jgi:HD-GYP domain-containing protein (c-di-GMP phosphodiesterase class II)